MPWSWHLFTAIKTLNKIEVGTRDWYLAEIDLIICLFGEIWNFVLCIWKAVECFNHSLISNTNINIEDIGAKSYVNCQRLTHEVTEENFSMLPRDC